MNGGFTFRGTHSGEYGVFCNPESRVLMPEKRRNPIIIPGRSGVFRQEDGGRDVRQESLQCYFVKRADTTVATQSRLIAGWLSEEGELNFDSEPDKYYRAYLVGAPPLEKHLQYGQFTLTFEMNPPFAYELPQSQSFAVTDQSALTLAVGGTVETPVRIIIRNVGTNTIRNIVLMHNN
jgi:predicted phage tail component-like protein